MDYYKSIFFFYKNYKNMMDKRFFAKLKIF